MLFYLSLTLRQICVLFFFRQGELLDLGSKLWKDVWQWQLQEKEEEEVWLPDEWRGEWQLCWPDLCRVQPQRPLGRGPQPLRPGLHSRLCGPLPLPEELPDPDDGGVIECRYVRCGHGAPPLALGFAARRLSKGLSGRGLQLVLPQRNSPTVGGPDPSANRPLFLPVTLLRSLHRLPSQPLRRQRLSRHGDERTGVPTGRDRGLR